MPTVKFHSTNRFPTTSEILCGINLRGKFAVVTGGSGGVGLATAMALVKAGADVVVTSRPGAKLDCALEALRSVDASGVFGVGIDLADIPSIRSAAATIRAFGRSIDFLVNNAGVIGPFALTDVGVEMGFMTNVVGHGVLTSLLSPSLVDQARIVCVSSFGHHYSDVIFDDINFERRPYAAWLSYGQSKTGCCLLAVHLSKELSHRGIEAFSLHPGAIQTEMGRSMVEKDFEMLLEKTGEIPPDDFVSPDQGAATTIWALTESRLAGHGGSYLQECAIAEVRDQPDYRTGVMRYAIDPVRAKLLWEVLEQVCGEPLPLR